MLFWLLLMSLLLLLLLLYCHYCIADRCHLHPRVCLTLCPISRFVFHVCSHTRLPSNPIFLFYTSIHSKYYNSWMNEFVQIEEHESILEVGDLVHMTIVDVFETDNNGRLLSYCPTFDNRDIRKTTLATETLRYGNLQSRCGPCVASATLSAPSSGSPFAC
jgi:hypothetical protein